MHHRSQTLRAAMGLLCAGAVLAGVPQSQPVWRKAVVVLIENERVLGGPIREDDEWVIMKHPAGQLRYAKSEVFRICDTYETLYELKRQEIEPRDPDEHVRLAQWCRRYKLIEQAKKELRLTLRLDPAHRQARTMLDSIEHLSGKRKPSDSTAGKRDQAEPADETGTPLLMKYDDWRKLQGRETIEEFSTRVQVMLLKRCGSGKCHGSGHKGALQLHRAASGLRRSKPATFANLRSVYRCIRFDKIEASPILVKPLLPPGTDPPYHGGGRIFNSADDRAYVVLKKWVLGLPGVSKPPKPSKPPRPVRPPRSAKTPSKKKARAAWPGTKKR